MDEHVIFSYYLKIFKRLLVILKKSNNVFWDLNLHRIKMYVRQKAGRKGIELFCYKAL